METDIFPENWKMSMVTPIKKVSGTNKCEKFRPIYSLKLCKIIFEKIVKKNNSKNTWRIIIFYLDINLGLENDIHANRHELRYQYIGKTLAKIRK